MTTFLRAISGAPGRFACRSVALLLLVLSTTPGSGEGATAGGFRGGLRFDPDQLVLGGQGLLHESGRNVRLRGIGTLGIGDDLTIFDLALDIHYVARSAPLADRTFFYVGGGPDVAFAWIKRRGDDGGDTDFGLALLGGIEHALSSGNRFFGEFRIHVHSDEWFEIIAGLDFTIGR